MSAFPSVPLVSVLINEQGRKVPEPLCAWRAGLGEGLGSGRGRLHCLLVYLDLCNLYCIRAHLLLRPPLES